MMGNDSQQIVQKLWRYCGILRDDGMSFPDYVEQLTYLLFLKMAYEQAINSFERLPIIPEEYNWQSLISKSLNDPEQLRKHYNEILIELSHKDGMLGVIFHEAKNKIQDPAKLKLLIFDLIDKENWTALKDIGDVYEGLLEKNAQDTKSGAGQYFTPRPVIEAIIECISPQLGETIYDPACGTCGFLLGAHNYIIRHNPNMTDEQLKHLRLKAFKGSDIVDEIIRLGAMNLLLHDIGPRTDNEGELPVSTQDSLKSHPGTYFNLILTNPPFGKKSSITVFSELSEKERQSLSIVRPDFLVTTSNKQLNFLQHICSTLEVNGRAAVVIPDNVLFEGGAGETIRRRLLHDYDVHTLLRLPPGIFYASGIKTNVLFIDRKPLTNEPLTKNLWVYDLRNNMHFTMRTNRLEKSDLEDFVKRYNPENRNLREATWSEDNPNGRWRSFTYDELIRRDKCSFDIFWFREEHTDITENVDLGGIASEILDDLQAAIFQISEITSDLSINE